MPRVLLMTVGVGGKQRESLVAGLKESVTQADYDRVVLFHTAESQPVAEDVEAAVGSDYTEWNYCPLKDENDVDNVFHNFLAKADDILHEHGWGPEVLTVDFTSGTKAMSAGAVLAAAILGSRKLSYVCGRRGENGTVMHGYENVQQLSLPSYKSITAIHKACEALRHLNFGVVPTLLQDLPAGQDGRRQPEVEYLSILASAYQAWDLFQHKEAARILGDNTGFLENFRDGTTDEFRDLYNTEVSQVLFRHQLTKKQKEPSLGLAMDLYSNARRRHLEGRYDDAVARLYRLTEIAGQLRLSEKFGISTGALKRDQVPPDRWSEYGLDSAETVKIGLHKAYQLLRDLGDDFGQAVSSQDRLGGHLQARNESILAHGFTPVSEETSARMLAEVLDLWCELDEGFKRKAGKLQFPWLREEENED